jgi:hypothetical protein
MVVTLSFLQSPQQVVEAGAVEPMPIAAHPADRGAGEPELLGLVVRERQIKAMPVGAVEMPLLRLRVVAAHLR